MTDLTEKLKKGTLPEGFYFVDDGAEITIDYYLCDYWERHFDSDIQQVLAPVPSYDELRNTNKVVNECMAANIKLVEQNTKLKELLKECRDDYVSTDLDDDLLLNQDIARYLVTRINTAIGESEE